MIFSLALYVASVFVDARFTAVRQTPVQEYPASCLFLSNTSHPVTALNLSFATSVCRENMNCADGAPMISFPDVDVISSMTCDSDTVYACETFIPLASSKLLALAQPLFRTLRNAGFNASAFWTQTNLQGEYSACALGNTETNVYLYDTSATDCSATAPILCSCIAPNMSYDGLILVTGNSVVTGIISVAESVVRIAIPGWYVVTNNSDTYIEFFTRGALLYFNGTYSVESVGDPFTEEGLLKLYEDINGFNTETMLGGISYTENFLIDRFLVTVTTPTPGWYELSSFVETPANTTLGSCPTCREQACYCMVDVNNTILINVTDYTQSPGLTTKLSVRLVNPK